MLKFAASLQCRRMLRKMVTRFSYQPIYQVHRGISFQSVLRCFPIVVVVCSETIDCISWAAL